jgi:peptidoglycan/LPS O-acetylase OafA/YrhL
MTMRRYGGIEGLRAWLAWMVVFSHLMLGTGFTKLAPELATALGQAADLSVMVFTIISGFVITHLILQRHEPYRTYIARRFLRIYPVYAVALLAGIAGTYLSFDTFLSHPWGTALSPPTGRLLKQAESLASSDFYWHLLAHLSMLHGAISSRVLYESQYMFLGPAWSLSLEWQFYLVAPLVVAMASRRAWQPVLAALAVAGFALYWHGRLGKFMLPSVLPGAALYFAVGIGTRFALRGGVSLAAYPLAALVLGFGLLVSSELRPVLVWLAFLGTMLLDPAASDLVSRWARQVFSAAFDSKLARWLGDRSYATYLIHMPIVQGVTWVCVRQMQWGPQATFAAGLAVAVPMTLVASALLHRFVELPAMAWGRRIR